MAGITEVVTATIAMYGHSAKDATRMMLKNWLIIPGSIVLCGIMLLAYYLFGNLGYAGGFLISIVELTLISSYFRWLDESVSGSPLEFKEMAEFDAGMFFRVLHILFMVFIINFLLIGVQQTNPEIMICIHFLIIVLLNAAPEIVYIHKYDGMAALTECVNFVKDNWIEWFLPFVIMNTPILIFISWTDFLQMMASGTLMVPGFGIAYAWLYAFKFWVSYIAIPLAILAGNWFMLFRGFLFKELNSGSRRQRIFKARTR